MLKPVILFKDDYASEANSVEAHILFEESNYKTESQIKVVGYGYDKLEAVQQLLEGLDTAKVAIVELISSTTEVERLQKAGIRILLLMRQRLSQNKTVFATYECSDFLAFR